MQFPSDNKQTTKGGQSSSEDDDNFVPENYYNLDRETSAAKRKINHIATGRNHVLAVDVGGRIYAWGMNDYGQLGLYSRAEKSQKEEKDRFKKEDENDGRERPVTHVTRPRLLDRINADFVKIFAGKNSSYGVTKEGSVYGWGDNSGNKFMLQTPKKVKIDQK